MRLACAYVYNVSVSYATFDGGADLPAALATDAFLRVFPPYSDPRGEDRELARQIKDVLDDYNNTPCQD